MTVSKLSLGATSHRAESPEIGRRKGPWGMCPRQCINKCYVYWVQQTQCGSPSPSFPNPYLDEHTHGRVMLHGLFTVGGYIGRYAALPGEENWRQEKRSKGIVVGVVGTSGRAAGSVILNQGLFNKWHTFCSLSQI